MQNFDGTFWLSLSGIILGFISGALIYCIKSKCSRCSLCFGLIDVHRDVALEEKIEEAQLEKGINPYEHKEEEKK
jgi:hypothetical protein